MDHSFNWNLVCKWLGTHWFSLCLCVGQYQMNFPFDGHNPWLTKSHKQDTSGCDGFDPIGCHTLVVAGIRGVQVLDAQPGAIIGLADDDALWLLHHWCIILQPPHTGWWIPGYLAVQNGCLALNDGDVVHWLQKIQKVTCKGIEATSTEWEEKGRVFQAMGVFSAADSFFLLPERNNASWSPIKKPRMRLWEL